MRRASPAPLLHSSCLRRTSFTSQRRFTTSTRARTSATPIPPSSRMPLRGASDRSASIRGFSPAPTSTGRRLNARPNRPTAAPRNSPTASLPSFAACGTAWASPTTTSSALPSRATNRPCKSCLRCCATRASSTRAPTLASTACSTSSTWKRLQARPAPIAAGPRRPSARKTTSSSCRPSSAGC